MLGEQLNSTESRGLLYAIDKMREVLHDERVTLPEIVVVGEQSAGKSSILEAISGIQLPRAQSICTRCPLELRMKATQYEEYAIIRGSTKCTAETRLDDLTKIADEVSRLTSEIAGEGVGVSSNPIYLTVYKRDILYDLTLIDLPGITRTPIKGQAENIHEQILDLIKKYIEPSTAIVLHVIPALIDFTTSETMKLAKAYDPSCQRQLIVASKIDKYDKGIAEKLQGRGSGSVDLQLGIVAVLNRSQDEIDNNISFEEMKRREKKFFLDHKDAFGHLLEEFKGTEQLVRRLAIIQQERIRSTFPDIIKKLRNHLLEKKTQLKRIPPPMNTEVECWASFQYMVIAFRESIHDNVKGEYNRLTSMDIAENDESDSCIEEDKLETKVDEEALSTDNDDEDHIAYRIYQLQRMFQKKCRESFSDFLSNGYRKVVLRKIDQTAGVSLPNFPSYQIIVGLFREELQKLPHCCHELVKQIHRYMFQCLNKLFDDAFNNEYPRLKVYLKDIIIKRLDEVKETLLERVSEVLETEQHVFTLNHYYMDTINRLRDEEKQKVDTQKAFNQASSPFGTLVQIPKAASTATNYAPVSNEVQAAKDIQFALHAYSKVVEKRLTDNWAQTCYYHFITKCALKLDQLLSTSIPTSQLVQYMREPQRQTNLRKKLLHSIEAYQEALQLGQEYQ